MENYIAIVEMIGTIAFAISGAMVAIKKKMDLLGVIVLGVVTAVGGGIIRDLILGITPPRVFLNPRCAMVSVLVSVLVFVFIYLKENKKLESFHRNYDMILMLSDAVGLGVFTVMGIQVAVETLEVHSGFLLLFVGTITGVGGGVLRDMMCGEVPYIFKKHIYATASIAGALLAIEVWGLVGESMAMLLGTVVVVIIRVLAAYFNWNLPRIKGMDN